MCGAQADVRFVPIADIVTLYTLVEIIQWRISSSRLRA
jgi:hypothetical protein